jgi:hypothetical protein
MIDHAGMYVVGWVIYIMAGKKMKYCMLIWSAMLTYHTKSC